MKPEEQINRLREDLRIARKDNREKDAEIARLRHLFGELSKTAGVRGVRVEVRTVRGKIVCVATAPGANEQALANLIAGALAGIETASDIARVSVMSNALREIAENESSPAEIRERASKALDDAGYNSSAAEEQGDQ